MAFAKWRAFCLGLNVLMFSCCLPSTHDQVCGWDAMTLMWGTSFKRLDVASFLRFSADSDNIKSASTFPCHPSLRWEYLCIKYKRYFRIDGHYPVFLFAFVFSLQIVSWVLTLQARRVEPHDDVRIWKLPRITCLLRGESTVDLCLALLVSLLLVITSFWTNMWFVGDLTLMWHQSDVWWTNHNWSANGLMQIILDVTAFYHFRYCKFFILHCSSATRKGGF